MKSPRVLQHVFTGALLASVGAMPVFAQAPATPVDAPTPASDWRKPVEDNQVLTFVTLDQLEGRTNGPNTGFRWDGQGWIGTDFNKLWIKSEGRVINGVASDGDHEFLYDRPIPHMRYLDWQAGARIDLDSGPTRAWAAIGVQGLAPYWFNFEPTIYVRDGGRVAGRLQGSYDLYLTQRLILQPQVEMNFYSQADPARGLGTGLSDLDGGVRLGYQFSRKFAPYVGCVYSGAFGQTATFSRKAGEPTTAHRFVFGVWLWH
ncbi:MAG TPA: copper resistance protein B [Bryobacteraceae bacterium]|nr:copper resistance protein B [Bryobacteraceae bacterium]